MLLRNLTDSVVCKFACRGATIPLETTDHNDFAVPRSEQAPSSVEDTSEERPKGRITPKCSIRAQKLECGAGWPCSSAP